MPALPTGTVTFLFTDIEGSTRLWERDRAAMATAVERHLALLRAAIEANGGVLFKVVGDAVQAAFPTAPQAVAAALAAQQSLRAEPWSEGSEFIAVRMALHTAAAEPRDGDYLAPGLNRLARLMAAPHGGQVVLSLATQDLARDALPHGASLRDLGEHPLRDLYRPERIFQLLHPDVPADFPVLRTLATRPNNLPLQQTLFVGREEQLARVVALLEREDVRLLTITGPGGVGKTRLALQAAADLLDDFPDGVWFVDLSALGDGTLVLPAIAAVLGVSEEGTGVLERLTGVLGGKRLLLVLDNFERVVAAAQTVADLLSRVPGLKVLATSRTPLRVYGEREYPLPPLPLPDPARLPGIEGLNQFEAVRLFIERAQAVKPDFVVTNANAPAVAEICFRLDGLPLAIELAAALVKVLPPQSLLKRLERRLPLLTGGARTSPARQQTMRDAIAWSHDLLTPDEQTLFRRQAVFPGGCTIEAAEAVAGEDGALDAFAGIASLVDKSLLRQEDGVDGEPRFRMLETVREYAGERLAASPDAEQAWRSHLAYLVRFATANSLDERPLDGPETEARMARLGAEEVNLRSGLEWGIGNDPVRALDLGAALGIFWFLHGRVATGLDLYERVLATGVGEHAPQRARVLAAAAVLALNLGDLARSQALADAAFALAEDLGDARGAAFARYCQGDIAMTQGEADRATVLLQDALDRYEAAGDEWGVAGCLNALGMNAVNQGDSETAIALYERFLTIADKHQSARNRAIALSNLAIAHYHLGHYEVALDLSNEELAIAEEIGSVYSRASSLAMLSLLALMRGEVARAAALARESIGLHWELGDKWLVAADLEAVAAILGAGGRAESAARVYGAAEALREAIDVPPGILEQRDHARHIAAVRTVVDEPAFARAWAEGRRLPLAAAVAEAKEGLATLAAPLLVDG